MNKSSSKNLGLFRSLFKGREDIFALRWENGKKSGYMPAYFYDPYRYRIHRINGGTFKNFNEKSLLSLTDEQINKHLDGYHHVGIYPLLKDNTSWFLAADFDKINWHEDALGFLKMCKKKGVPAYLERSQSGNGGHVWIFFDKPYPAFKSRKIFIDLLEQSGAFSIFEKDSSFDRVFPNQDSLSGKGFGNLIALPLFKPALEKGNSAFVHPDSLVPFPDQWAFLNSVKKTSTKQLERLLEETTSVTHPQTQNKSNKLSISLGHKLSIQREDLGTKVINYLREELNFSNAAYFVKKNSGRSTFETPRYFNLIEESNNEILIPRGFTGRLLRFCRACQIEYKFHDNRKLQPFIPFRFNASLRSHQKKAMELISQKDFGVIVSPPGAGKTIIGLKIVAEKRQPSLIIVHRKQLLLQWIDRIESFLGIPKKEIGIIGQGKGKIGKQITVATIQSLPKKIESIRNKFGTLIIDECHHVPAETFRNTIEKLNTYFLYGLTATPFRKYNDGKIIFTHLGNIIANIQPDEIEDFKKPEIIIRNTNFNVPYDSKTDNFEVLSKMLIHDTSRNDLILKDVKTELNQGKKVIILTERKDHIASLYLLLKHSYEVISLSGEDSNASKKTKGKLLKEGNFQALITTGQYFGEGSDLQHISRLFLVYPFSFEGKLIQYIGRVQRSEITPRIYDYRDYNVDFLNKLFLKRNSYYRKIQRVATLFDEPSSDLPVANDEKKIEKSIKVKIEDLSFHYGFVSFSTSLKKGQEAVEFQLENIEVRPEFGVLKPYFIKVLKSKTITVDVAVEYEEAKIVSQLAYSPDLQRINKKLIESVKFHFLQNRIFSKTADKKKNILKSEELLENQNVIIDGEELIKKILTSGDFLHTRQIHYLISRHESEIIKIRFVLQPFSFVFLLAGTERYFFVLETLDTQEATYIWNTPKSITSLYEKIDLIDRQLGIIREKGRQAFLENHPDNFTRVIHDYSNESKGFIAWKAAIEEIV